MIMLIPFFLNIAHLYYWIARALRRIRDIVALLFFKFIGCGYCGNKLIYAAALPSFLDLTAPTAYFYRYQPIATCSSLISFYKSIGLSPANVYLIYKNGPNINTAKINLVHEREEISNSDILFGDISFENLPKSTTL